MKEETADFIHIGRRYKTVSRKTEDEAIAFIDANPNWGVLDVGEDGTFYIADCADLGVPINPPVKRPPKRKGPRKPYVPVVPPLHVLKAKLERVEKRLRKLGHEDAHLAGLSRHFHLGRVGGSGRNTARLNRRREAALDKSIREAKLSRELQGERNYLLSQIRTYDDES